MIRTPYGIASTFTPGRPQKPVRNPDYLKFVRSLPSAVSGRYGCEACHTGAHGIGQKSSDLSVIPLTRKEHREFDAAPRAYAEKHGLDIPALIARLNSTYELLQAGKLKRGIQSEAADAATSQSKERAA